MHLTDLFYLLPALIICYMWIALWKKRRTRTRRLASETSEPIDFKILDEAQTIADQSPSILEQYNEKYVAIGKFSTVQAFTSHDMDRVVSELAKLDIEARYHLIEMMPAGAITALGAAGYFQIWVEPCDQRRTREFLSTYFGKEF